MKILVVEDEMLVSLLVEEVLLEQHCLIVGPFDRVPNALSAAQVEPIDFAILDVNVAGEKIYPVAEVLESRGIPFFFLSGYGRNAIPADRPHWQVCSKPFDTEDLLDMLRAQFRGR